MSIYPAGFLEFLYCCSYVAYIVCNVALILTSTKGL